MQRSAVPYRTTARFSKVVLDYLDDAEHLREFHPGLPDRERLLHASTTRKFDPVTRTVLCDAIERQYAGMEMRPEVRANLERLRSSTTVTVTTGHQLCLFTGPLYVPFKILNVIRSARELSTAQAECVPVFWMATEDHDREEIDHAWVGGKKIVWPGTPGGAVGRLPLEGIDAVLDQVDEALGFGTRAEEMSALLRRCYRPEHTLAHATRLFVDALFGRFGLVVLDADDHGLKELFAPLMREELLNQVALRTVNHANEKLSDHYPVQAHVREINLFHLRPGHRSRIELSEEGFHAVDGGPRWTVDELLTELEEHPEHFSPNVLMRPLYQETILPNIAYVGGGGELAYWFQLRWLFQAFQVPMPLLMLRTSAAFLRPKDIARTADLHLQLPDLFLPQQALETRLALEHASFNTSLAQEHAALSAIFERLALRAKNADPTLEGAARAWAKRAMNGADAMERKFIRAAKREQEDVLQRLRSVHAQLFPDGGLQERRDNFMPFYVQEGPAFFDRLLAELDPLDARFSLLPA